MGNPVRKGIFKVGYNGKDITADISAHVLSVEYSDNTEGKADTIEITVQDKDKIWQNDWYPTKGDKLTLSFGFDDILVDAGIFEIDEITTSSPPDIMTMKGIATPVTGKLRSKNSFAHEKKTLAEIAKAVASKHGLTVKGKIENVQFDRITQDRETDLGFLYRLASMFGYVFSVRGKTLTFTNIFDLEKSDPVMELNRADCASYSINDKISNSFGAVQVQYHNPVKKEIVKYKVEQKANADDVKFNYIQTDDTIEIKHKVENPGQAELVGKAALHKANSMQQSGEFEASGQPQLLAGINFKFTGIGFVSGVYHIITSKHKIDKGGGYTTSGEIKRVGFVQIVKRKTVKKTTLKPVAVRVVGLKPDPTSVRDNTNVVFIPRKYK